MDEHPEVQPLPEPATIDSFTQPKRSFKRWLVIGLLLDTLIISAIAAWFFSTAPNYQTPIRLSVEPGQTVSEVITETAEAGVVRSGFLLYLVSQVYYRDDTIKTGSYMFTSEQDVFAVAKQLYSTVPADELISVTFPEGITVATMADIAAATLSNVSAADFLAETIGLEGELLPETYFVPLDYTTTELVALLQEKQDTLLSEQQVAVAASGYSEQEIIILASILEREANDEASMKLVAGIFNNRLNIDMALQADATIEYVLETPLNELRPGELAENLRELDSPYNTYLNTGLPPTPIGNPGAQAILAVLNPTPSEYLFYITGNDGVFYYAETYAQHLRNIERYLR